MMFYVEKNIVTMMDTTLIHYDPLGVVLIMGSWNYPLQLSLGPLAGAISAGNCVIIKPSELAPATSCIIASLIPRYLDMECFKVVEGGIAEWRDLTTFSSQEVEWEKLFEKPQTSSLHRPH
jgi:acyl-CoA reductase-like NAD-dependent aldehyde dehydrogenase